MGKIKKWVDLGLLAVLLSVFLGREVKTDFRLTKLVSNKASLVFVRQSNERSKERRIVSFDVYVDEEAREKEDYKTRIENLTREVSQVFDEFGIEFRIDSFYDWKSDDEIKDVERLFRDLKREKRKSDLVVGFTGQQISGDERGGFAEILGNRVLLTASEYSLMNKLSFIHELGHVFGAEDTYRKGYMNAFPFVSESDSDSLDWDGKNFERIRKYKERIF